MPEWKVARITWESFPQGETCGDVLEWKDGRRTWESFPQGEACGEACGEPYWEPCEESGAGTKPRGRLRSPRATCSASRWIRSGLTRPSWMASARFWLSSTVDGPPKLWLLWISRLYFLQLSRRSFWSRGAPQKNTWAPSGEFWTSSSKSMRPMMAVTRWSPLSTGSMGLKDLPALTVGFPVSATLTFSLRLGESVGSMAMMRCCIMSVTNWKTWRSFVV
mmetsp:Transcript_35364/g.105083  ORF Transcript_35364/g.105083 Transcript_35364/m.105083 type:complete len:220 (-) Transcript_35364:1195-1854(-)